MYHHSITVLALSQAIQQARLAGGPRPESRCSRRREVAVDRSVTPIAFPAPAPAACPEQWRAS